MGYSDKKDKLLGMRRRQDDISGLFLIICVDVHMGLDPLPRPHASI